MKFEVSGGFLMKVLGFLFGALVGGGSVILFLTLRDTLSLSPPSVFLFVPILAAALFLTVLIHELGHFAAGKMVGYRFYILTVGPLMVEKRSARLRFRLNKYLNVAGGLTLMLPDGNHFRNRELAWFIAGGPAASILAALLFIYLPFLLPETDGTGLYNLLLYSILLTGVVNALIGFLSLAPEQSGELETDGKQLLDLRRGGHRAEVRQLVMQITLDSFSGIRPSDLDRDLIERLLIATSDVRDSDRILAHLYAYLSDIDSGRSESAEDHLNRAVELSHEAEKKSIIAPTTFLEAAFYEAFYKKNPDRARVLAELARKGYTEESSVIRMEAAIAMAEGDTETAVVKANKAIELTKGGHDKGGGIWEEEVLRKIAENNVGTPTTPGQP